MSSSTAPLEETQFSPSGHAGPRHAPRPGATWFGLLGPLEICVKGHALELRKGRESALLVVLLLRVGEIVSRDRLIDALWNEQPPKAAVSSLQNLVSALRKRLGAELVRTSASGYSLDIPQSCVDARHFEHLAARAFGCNSMDERSDQLRNALALWRGPALADFSSEPFAQLEIARLEELRITARAELIDLELERGHHARLVGELEVLVASYPLRERLRAQLMLALYRSGRQAEALEVYKQARREMQEQLGLEPGPELRALERAVLTHDPRLRPAPETRPPIGDGRRVTTTVSLGAGVRISSRRVPSRFVLRLPWPEMATPTTVPH